MGGKGYIVLGIILALFAILQVMYIKRQPKSVDYRSDIQISDSATDLKRQCCQQLQIHGAEASRVVNDLVSRLKKIHPGHTEKWYLEKVLWDLERDNW